MAVPVVPSCQERGESGDGTSEIARHVFKPSGKSWPAEIVMAVLDNATTKEIIDAPLVHLLMKATLDVHNHS